jgi:serine/threonine-protein kinase
MPEDRYRIVRLHAKGGLGEVFVADDMELNRQVALKRMQERCRNDPDSRRRFLQETEITARLEHPGIVPVHGLVQDQDGNPCYAMRFIQGESLEEALRRFHEADSAGRAPGERSLGLRHLLSRFVAVCNAVAYAHNRGILHRDLKPGNVMLGKFGETLVVDWGLAKPIERDAEARAGGEATLMPVSAGGDIATRVGEALGTPSYMSPEQAAGQWQQVGPGSDVFGLGAILYAILVGRPPVSAADVREKLNKVKRGDFPRPRQVKPCPPALEAICLKAMALRPEQRYPTALALAADVEHWLADEPVTAWPEPWRVRAWRWVRRHPGRSVGAVAALLLAAVVTAAVGLVQAARQREDQAQTEAELTALKARQESARARENYELALSTSDQIVGQAQTLKRLPGSRIDSLRHLLSVAEKSYGRMLSQAPDEPVLLERTGHLLNALSELYIDLGNTSKALQSGRRAEALFEDLLKRDAARLSWQRGLAVSLERVGMALWWQGDPVEGLASCRRALDVRQRIAPPAADKLAWQLELATLQNRIGVFLAVERDFPAARNAYQKSLAIAQALVRDYPKDSAARNRLGISLIKIGQLLFTRKPDDPRALEHFEKAVALLRGLIRDDPNNTEWYDSLMNALGWAGDARAALGDLDRARKCYKEGLTLATRFSELDPGNETRQSDVLLARGLLARLQKATDPTEAARDRIARQEQDHALFERRVRRDPENAVWQMNLVQRKAEIADGLARLVLRHQGKPIDLERAVVLLRRAFATHDELRQRYPKGLLIVSVYMSLCSAKATVLRAQNKTAEALAFEAKGRQAQADFFKRRARQRSDPGVVKEPPGK